MSAAADQPECSGVRAAIETVGRFVRHGVGSMHDGVAQIGGVTRLYLAVGHRLLISLTGATHPVRWEHLVAQSVRVGVRSIPIIIVVQVFIGIILALSLARPLSDFGQLDRVADVVALAMFREMGALISGVVLSGFAGASIAAELGAMVEGEEVKALRAHALDPIRFLVAPRITATAVMMIGLTAMANVVGVVGGFGTSVIVLGINPLTYIDMTRDALTLTDYFTGLLKGGVFGLLIGGIACFLGLNVRGGSVGVGLATTMTVVISIVSLIAADCMFAIVFYTLELW